MMRNICKNIQSKNSGVGGVLLKQLPIAKALSVKMKFEAK